MSPVHSRGSPTPSTGRKFKSGPLQRGTKSKVAASPLSSRRPKRGRKCYMSPACSGIPNLGDKNQKWLPHPCFSGAQKRAEIIHHPCILGDPQHRGTNLKVAASPLSSRRPKRGRKCYITSAFLGIPNIGDKVKSGCLTLAFSGAQKRAEMLRHPCILRDPQHQVWQAKSEVVPNIGEQNLKWLPHPCLLGGAKEGGNATSPLHSWGSPT